MFSLKQLLISIFLHAVNNDGKTPLENTANKNIIDFLTYYKCPICWPWKLIVIIISGNILIVITLFIFGVRCKYFKNDSKRRGALWHAKDVGFQRGFAMKSYQKITRHSKTKRRTILCLTATALTFTNKTQG